VLNKPLFCSLTDAPLLEDSHWPATSH
jgi:hypothetical protein